MKKLLAILTVVLLATIFIPNVYSKGDCHDCPPPCPGCGSMTVSDEAYMSAYFNCIPVMEVVGTESICFGSFFTGNKTLDISDVCKTDDTKKLHWKMWGPEAADWTMTYDISAMGGHSAEVTCKWWWCDKDNNYDFDGKSCHWPRGSTSCQDQKDDVQTLDVWCMPDKVNPHNELGMKSWKVTCTCTLTL